MPTQDIKKAQTESKSLQVIIDLEFPPRTVDAEGTVRYGTISQTESKGVDADGNPAANVYWSHDEVPGSTKAGLVGVLLTDVAPFLAAAGISVDLTPTPFEPPTPEPEADPA